MVSVDGPSPTSRTCPLSSEMKPDLLLHICCAPCATCVVELLGSDFRVHGFFYNPNIHPEEEYERRLEAVRKYAEAVDLDWEEGPYEPEGWFSYVREHEDEPEGGARCSLCYRLRLEETARRARELGFGYFATTLTIGPNKKARIINPIGRELGFKYGPTFVGGDFKKGKGFERSVVLSRRFELYRQDYCGCTFSLRERRRSL
ncbi:MAG TPA: epoxyqueuosine reductase QueH [Candidatus Latescibacteria bacterium]|nr:epoxyqueuosine reductase QueH [Candidatus Latescibacterota bacterium]